MTKEEVLENVKKLSEKEQDELIYELKESTFERRFYKFIDSLQIEDLSETEVLKEVEIVRKKRFEEGKHQSNS